MEKDNEFRFKKFSVSQESSTHKVGTDGVLLGAWANAERVESVLDIGTGSGLIALMMAQRTPDHVTIDAVELQSEDAKQATLNVNRSPWAKRISVFETAIQDFKPPYLYDLVVSNPPFFTNSLHPPSGRRLMARHQESLSANELLSSVKRVLKKTGRLAIIMPYQEGMQLVALAETHYGFYCIRQCNVKSRASKAVERVLLEISGIYQAFVKEDLLLYNETNQWSEAYKKLTGDFYLNM